MQTDSEIPANTDTGNAAPPKGASGLHEHGISHVVLYVFSGPHMGAQLALKEGAWLLGSDDACDIILQGASVAARHASVRVTMEQSGRATVTGITPLDAPVTLEGGAEAPSPYVPLAGEVWFLGLTCMVWNYAGVHQPVPEASFGRQVAVTQSPSDPVVPAGSSSGAGQPAANGESDNIVAATQGETAEMGTTLEAAPADSGSMAMVRRALAVLLLLVCLGGLTVTYTSGQPQDNNYYSVLTTQIAESGLKGLQVQQAASGLVVTGAVKNDAELHHMYTMARNLPVPVYLDSIVVRADAARAVQVALQARGFAPRVSQMTEAGETDPILHVAGYMKDSLVEEQLFKAMSKELVGLPRLERRIIHEPELAEALEPVLNGVASGRVEVQYLAGSVVLQGKLAPQEAAQVTKAVQDVADDLGIELAMTLDSSVSVPASVSAHIPETATMSAVVQADRTAARPTQQKATAKAGGTGGMGLQVTGVTMQPMRFVSTADGQHLFEGALLPNGYVLKKIATGALTLQKGGITHVHRLQIK